MVSFLSISISFNDLRSWLINGSSHLNLRSFSLRVLGNREKVARKENKVESEREKLEVYLLENINNFSSKGSPQVERFYEDPGYRTMQCIISTSDVHTWCVRKVMRLVLYFF